MANNQPIPVPPLAEQHRIVARVDELMALCDRLEAAREARETARDRLAAASLARLNRPDPDPKTFRDHAAFTLKTFAPLTTRPDQIKAMRQTIINLAVRGKLVPQDASEEPVAESPMPILAQKAPLARKLEQDDNEAGESLPNSWRWVCLADLLAEDSLNGYSRRPDDAVDGCPILRISAGTMRHDGIVAEEEHKLISGLSADLKGKFRLKRGDLLACRFNGNKAFVGRLTLFQDYLRIAPIFPDKLIRLRINMELAIPEFIRIAGDAEPIRASVEAFCATTVGNWGISASNLKKVLFPLPPLAEQRRIIAKVDELMTLCDRLEASLTATDATRRRLLDSILHQVLSPAEALPAMVAARG